MSTNNYVRALSFKAAQSQLRRMFQSANQVHTQRWQGIAIKNRPEGKMLELLNATVHVPQVPRTITHLVKDLEGFFNYPWAENHFLERVSVCPMNPGTEWENWPDGKSAAKFLNKDGQFNHNYMERYWPKFAGKVKVATKTAEDYAAAERQLPFLGAHRGIRDQTYGDLMDLVNLLADEPDTRQAYMPIFFPEDTGIGDGDRKPCTLGYHFIVRDKKLHIYYPMRSCDFYRHWGDDVYLTVRLGMWIRDELRERDPTVWDEVTVGSLTMHCTSLHMFINDYLEMEKVR